MRYVCITLLMVVYTHTYTNMYVGPSGMRLTITLEILSVVMFQN